MTLTPPKRKFGWPPVETESKETNTFDYGGIMIKTDPNVPEGMWHIDGYDHSDITGEDQEQRLKDHEEAKTLSANSDTSSREWLNDPPEEVWASTPASFELETIRLMKSHRSTMTKSAWVTKATAELAKTGARRAIPKGLKVLGLKDALYV